MSRFRQLADNGGMKGAARIGPWRLSSRRFVLVPACGGMDESEFAQACDAQVFA